MTLLSPGVSVSVIDESFYATSGAGTVPLIFIGTAENKASPTGSGIAPGTVPGTANTLYTISSQRDLIQTFGNPLFYSSQGTPINGYELNEYGLHAAYDLLAVTNTAYVLRCDIDYSQLAPTTVAPTSEPLSGTYWLDTVNTSWGVFESNGNSVPGLAWQSENTTVINATSQTNSVILGTALIADPTATSLISAASTFTINSTEVAIAANSSLNDVVAAVNTAAISNIAALALRVAGKSYIAIQNTAGGGITIGNTSTSALLAALGLTSPGVAITIPALSLAVEGKFAVVTLTNDNVIYQCLVANDLFGNDTLSVPFWYEIGSANWMAALGNIVTGSSTPGSVSTSDTLTLSADGGTTVLSVPMTGVTTTADVAAAINAAVAGLSLPNVNSVLAASVVGSSLVISNSIGGSITLGQTGTVLTVLGFVAKTYKGNTLVYAPHNQVPAGSIIGDIWVKTTQYNSGALYVVKVYNGTTGTWTQVNAPLYANDAAATTGLGSNLGINSVYVQYNLYGSTSNPIASSQLRIYNGTSWAPLSYQASASAPTAAPAAGTYWYNNNFQVDIMVGTGQNWVGYLNYSQNLGTDPNGVILDGSQPTTQSTGAPLVDNDLWINTSNTEDYPLIYRYTAATQTWTLIDNTDSTTPFGIIFADARETADGTQNGSVAIGDMLVSDFVDPDAPDPRTYPDGMLLFNTRYSTYNVKQWQPNWFVSGYENTNYLVNGYQIGETTFPALTYAGRWVTASGNRTDGSPYMGRKAQRQMIVVAMAATINSNQNILSELVYFNLIVCPGYMEVFSDLIQLNDNKKNVAFIIGDTPCRLAPDSTSITNYTNPTAGTTDVTDSETALFSTSDYLGVYYPWGLGTNIDGTSIMIPPSTMVLRAMVKSDAIAYPWFAPAGTTRGLIDNATSVGYLNSAGQYTTVFLNQGQRDTLYTNLLNPLLDYPNVGLYIDGQITRSGTDSALNRINVARLINYLNYNLDIVARPFLFEPNDTQTQTAVQTVFERFLGNLMGLRALTDYIVVCDSSNNTPTTIDLNELFVDIAIIPEKAIEFIYIPVRIENTGTNLSALYSPTQNS